MEKLYAELQNAARYCGSDHQLFSIEKCIRQKKSTKEPILMNPFLKNIRLMLEANSEILWIDSLKNYWKKFK